MRTIEQWAGQGCEDCLNFCENSIYKIFCSPLGGVPALGARVGLSAGLGQSSNITWSAQRRLSVTQPAGSDRIKAIVLAAASKLAGLRELF